MVRFVLLGKVVKGGVCEERDSVEVFGHLLYRDYYAGLAGPTNLVPVTKGFRFGFGLEYEVGERSGEIPFVSQEFPERYGTGVGISA